MAKRKVTWTKLATRQFDAAIDHIRKQSPQNADKVKEKILQKTEELSNDKVVHRKDPNKKDNDGNYLYFEMHKYRITYYTKQKEVFIIRVRHTSMEPKNY